MKNFNQLKIIFLILLFSFASQSFAVCSERERKSAIDISKTLLQDIKEQFDSRDVSNLVDEVNQRLSNCQIELSSFGLTPEVLRFWVKRGYQASYRNLVQEVQFQSQIGALPKELVGKIEFYGR